MVALSLPFEGNNETLYNNIINNRRFKHIPNFYSKNLHTIINSMLIIDPSKRPSINILLNFPDIKENIKKLNPIYIAQQAKKKFFKIRTYREYRFRGDMINFVHNKNI